MALTTEVRLAAAKARHNPDNLCGAPTPNGKYPTCHRWAGARTTHKGEGYCWMHDKETPRAKIVDLTILSEEEAQDPEVLELKGEIKLARAKLEEANADNDLRTLALLMDTIRKMVQTKDKIERERRYLIPVSVAVNVARRLTEVVSKYLPPEQRWALKDEVTEVLRTELALDRTGAWSDPAARRARRG